MILAYYRGAKLKFYQTKEFKILAGTWNKKLIASGFIDAEKTVRGERVLEQNAANVYRQTPKEIREAKAEYFNIISENTRLHQFEKELDQKVMAAFSNGLKIVEIASKYEIYRNTVTYIIRRYEHIWGMKYWTAKKRNLRHG